MWCLSKALRQRPSQVEDSAAGTSRSLPLNQSSPGLYRSLKGVLDDGSPDTLNSSFETVIKAWAWLMAPFHVYLILAFSAAGANKTLGLFLNGCVRGLCPSEPQTRSLCADKDLTLPRGFTGISAILILQIKWSWPRHRLKRCLTFSHRQVYGYSHKNKFWPEYSVSVRGISQKYGLVSFKNMLSMSFHWVGGGLILSRTFIHSSEVCQGPILPGTLLKVHCSLTGRTAKVCLKGAYRIEE